MGATKVLSDFQTAGYSRCKVVDSEITASMTVTCDTPVEGRYVAVQHSGTSKRIAVCELKVFATEGTREFIESYF